MKLDADWVTSKPSQAILSMLENAGYQAFFVGGCVRNELLGVPVADYDVCTDALPETVSNLAKNEGFHVIPTGIDHGTVTVICDSIPFEITTFRKDVATDGRHATVAFSQNVADDARRRDFTMNALYVGKDGQVVDPLGGLADLRSRIFRFIDDPMMRIKEDYLRILRFFRFYAWYGDPEKGLDPDGLAACAELAEGIDALSRERVGSEILKLLAAPNPAPAIASMSQSGVLMRVLPGAQSDLFSVLIHQEDILSEPVHNLRRLAALSIDVNAKSLRLSKKQATYLAKVKSALGHAGNDAEIGYRFGEQVGLDTALIKSMIVGVDIDPNIAQNVRFGASQTFPIRAVDLDPSIQGAEIGRRLRQLETRWVESGFTLTKADLLDADT